MINPKLNKLVPDATSHIAKNVFLQIIGLISNIVLMVTISTFIGGLINKTTETVDFWLYVVVLVACIAVKVCTVYLASTTKLPCFKISKEYFEGENLRQGNKNWQ